MTSSDRSGFISHLAPPHAMSALPIDETMVVSGTPVAEGVELYTTPDGRTSWGLFRCTPGVFRHVLESDEVTHVLSGRMLVHVDGGPEIDARSGHTFALPAGASMLIEVVDELTDLYLTWSPS